jgi:HEAT repeat protein
MVVGSRHYAFSRPLVAQSTSAQKGCQPPSPIFALDRALRFVKITPMPRCSFNSAVIFSALLLLIGCDRPTPKSSPHGTVSLATNGPVLVAALRNRDPQTRAEAARLIAVNSIAVDPSALTRALDDSNPDVRGHCATALGKMRAQSALRPLLPLLQDDNWYVRAEAATALGRIGDPRVAGWLLQVLGDGDAYVRLCASTALREVTAESHRAMLLQAFGRAPPSTRPAIAMALAKLHEPVALDQLIGVAQTNDVVLRRQATEALGDYSAPAVTNILTTLLRDPDDGVKREAARALQRMKTPPIGGQ